MEVETRSGALRRLIDEHVAPPIRRVIALQLPDRAASLAYYGFLSVPAVLLLTLGIIGLVYEPDDITRLVDRGRGVVPDEALTLIENSLGRVADGSASGVTLVLVAIPLALWSASGAMGALIRALNAVHGVTETRNFVAQRMVAAGMMLWLLLAVVLVTGLMILGPVLSRWIGDAVGARGLVQLVWWTAQWPLLIGGVMLAFTGILGLGPNPPVTRPRRSVVRGAFVATVLWLIVSGAFSVYLNRFGAYGDAWGPLSVVVVMLTWMWLSSIMLLIGAYVDAARGPAPPSSGG